MKHKYAIVTLAGTVWLLFIFALIRIALPSLVMMHNDGALFAIPCLLIAVGALSYVTYQYIREILE